MILFFISRRKKIYPAIFWTRYIHVAIQSRTLFLFVIKVENPPNKRTKSVKPLVKRACSFGGCSLVCSKFRNTLRKNSDGSDSKILVPPLIKVTDPTDHVIITKPFIEPKTHSDGRNFLFVLRKVTVTDDIVTVTAYRFNTSKITAVSARYISISVKYTANRLKAKSEPFLAVFQRYISLFAITFCQYISKAKICNIFRLFFKMASIVSGCPPPTACRENPNPFW